MSLPLEALDEAGYVHLLEPLWRYLALAHPPGPSDVIFVFGSRDLAVPQRAAELYRAGHAAHVLVSGRLGPMTQHVFPKAEALVFRDLLLEKGVPERAITTEVEARNTLENVTLGMTALRVAGHAPRSALLVAKAFVMRRCLATFARHHPDIAVRACPPAGGLVDHVDRPRAAFAARLVAELDRLDRYGAAGDIAPQRVPALARDTAGRVQRRLDRRP
jgi:uncharacterized SAM-binding protein YcdF (DUF218 family)